MSDGLNLPLTHLLRRADPQVAAPWLLVLMHGVGSHEGDMFSLAPLVPPGFHVLSLRAPHALGPQANAWFEVQFSPAGPRINPAQEEASRTLLAQTVASAAQQLGVPAQRVLAGGFSQGGIMGLSLLLTRPDLVNGAVVLHSRLLEHVVPLIAPAEQLRGHRLWVSHGTEDNVIPLARAHALRERVATLPLDLSYHEFPGGHELRSAELEALQDWLAQAISP